MIKMHGKNDFNGCFDFFKWSAPIYETPEEVGTAMENLQLNGKIVKSVSTIGYAEPPDEYAVNRILIGAGMSWEEIERDHCKARDRVMLPCKIRLWEPFQIIFSDGTTLEFLPMEHGGARIGNNTIPAGLTNGLNRSNLDAQKVFGPDLTDAVFQGVIVGESKEEEKIFYPGPNGEQWHDNWNRKKYRYTFAFEHMLTMEVNMQTDANGYTLGLVQRDLLYSQIRCAKKQQRQIVIYPGYGGGGYVWVIPSFYNEEKYAWKKIKYSHWAVSIEDDRCYELLSVFVDRYFDLAAQKEPDNFYQSEFDWYGNNYYRLETMEAMLADIRKTAKLLIEDYDDPELDEVKEHLTPSLLCVKDWNWKKSEEKAKLVQENIDVAADFYNRFADRGETAIHETKNCDCVVFSGP